MRKIILTLLAVYGYSAMCGDGVRIKIERATSKTEVSTCWGSGVFVKKHFAVTCWHVLDEGGQVYIEVDGKWRMAVVVKKDVKEDLALLRTEAEGVPVEFATIPALVISGSIKAQPVKDTLAGLNEAIIKCDADIGDSGAPVTCEGKLIGIVKAKILINEKEFGAKIISVDVIADFVK